MEGTHRLLACFIALWICIEFSYSTPCGAGSLCSCFEEINLITCAAKGLKHFPNMDTAEKLMCKTLILDINEITSLAEFEVSEWPQLKEMRLRKNPKDICEWTSDLREYVGSRMIITDDCDISKERKPLDEVSETIHRSNLPKIKTNDVNMRPITVSGIVVKKTDSNDLDKSADNSDVDREMTTVQMTKPWINIATTKDYYENTTLPEGWGVDAVISNNKLVIVISVPISILGIAFVFVVKLIWRRSNPRSVSVDVTTRPRRSGWLNCCNKKKSKRSPTPSVSGMMMGKYTYENAASLTTSPSMFSINSSASDDLFEFRSNLPAPSNSGEGIYLNI